MQKKVKNIVDGMVEVLKGWQGTRAVVLQHFAEKDIYDAGFSITLDVLKDGAIPDREERRNAFPEAQYFETSLGNLKDRFLVKELPVHISYKEKSWVNAVLDAVEGETWLTMERGTYLFYRLSTGTLLWSADDWMTEVVSRLDSLPETFWTAWSDFCRSRLDHLLSDMGSAMIKDDALFFHLSLANFLQAAAQTLFSVNRVFEPSPRDYSAALALLEDKPEGFEANWNSLLRDGTELPPERKREVATLLARSIFSSFV